jgi:hypothetical protein
MLKSSVTESSQLQRTLPMKWFSIFGRKLNMVLMCVVPLLVPILRLPEHIRNFVSSSIRKYTHFYINTLYVLIYITTFIFCGCGKNKAKVKVKFFLF